MILSLCTDRVNILLPGWLKGMNPPPGRWEARIQPSDISHSMQLVITCESNRYVRNMRIGGADYLPFFEDTDPNCFLMLNQAGKTLIQDLDRAALHANWWPNWAD